MKITIIGTGYVGLVTGACFAEVGNDVLCLDLNADKVRILNEGHLPIYEPGLLEIVSRNKAVGRLRFATDIEASVAFGDVQVIAVGTPPGEDGGADLEHVLAAARNIGRTMTDYRLVVDKSTVPVGTADLVADTIANQLKLRNRSLEFDVVSNPEFLKEGAAVEDFMRPDRIVVGSNSERATQIMRSLYAPFQRNHERLIHMDVRSAELTKYAANAMLATRISFMNELANLSEQLGADIEHVRKGIGSDPRIGYHFLYPGAGYGGSCFPKDVKALLRTASKHNVQLKVMEAVEAANQSQKQILGRKIVARFGGNLKGKKFSVWGLAFKPNTDDMRDAASVELINTLLECGAQVTAYDPAAMDEAKRIFAGKVGISFADNPVAALENADALAIVTEWKEFRSPDFSVVASKLKQRVIFDGRNLYEPGEVRRYGLEYYPIGRQ